MKPLHKPRSWQASDSIGWLFMGEQGGPCDKSCVFCYYAFQKNLVFYDLPTMIGIANLFRHYYKLDGADITGGEPTIYKHIVELVQHCANIGLSPRIITHGQNLHDGWKMHYKEPVYKLVEEAGLELWRVSLHGGSPQSHDLLLAHENSFAKLTGNLDNLTKPVHFNTTITNTNFNDLPVGVLKDRPATVYNMIWFNPYFYWSTDKGMVEADFQVKYREAAEHVAGAIQELEARGWEVNVRYFPLCIAQEFGFAENVCNYFQVPFDPWEWRLTTTARKSQEQIRAAGGTYQAEMLQAREWMKGRDNQKCASCSLSQICDKPPEQYQKKYGLDEVVPQSGPPIHDPLHFQRLRGVPAPVAVEA